MFTGLMAETVTRLRGVPVLDPYSGEATDVDWTTPDSLTIPRASVQPEQGSEETFDRDMVTSRWRLWAPGSPDIDALDRIVHAGETYEIDGEVLRWPGRLAHTTCLLKRTEG